MTSKFIPTRNAACKQLENFIDKAGTDYAAARNYDRCGHDNVSCLSPYIRHRMLHETEILRSVLGKHSYANAEKFIQEIYWRSYWKGWLAMRPALWPYACTLATQAEETPDYKRAIQGKTGIDCFDAWVNELLETGYLHNHARMWFASIWIFTLGLPWAQGASFFMRHLLDGDAAANTLSWRWVAGLHSQGKHYLATAENIKKYTDGRFNPTGLATQASPVKEPIQWVRQDLQNIPITPPDTPYMLLITDEDMMSDWLIKSPYCKGIIFLNGLRNIYGPLPRAWKEQAMASRKADILAIGIENVIEADSINALGEMQAQGKHPLVSAYIPDGYLRDAGLTEMPNLCMVQHPFDAQTWPHATHGFFTFRKQLETWCDDYKS